MRTRFFQIKKKLFAKEEIVSPKNPDAEINRRKFYTYGTPILIGRKENAKIRYQKITLEELNKSLNSKKILKIFTTKESALEASEAEKNSKESNIYQSAIFTVLYIGDFAKIEGQIKVKKCFDADSTVIVPFEGEISVHGKDLFHASYDYTQMKKNTESISVTQIIRAETEPRLKSAPVCGRK